MNEIKCPKCGGIFTVDEAGYANIVNQVRNKEFSDDLNNRIAQLSKENETKIKLVKEQEQKESNTKISERDLKISQLKSQLDQNDSEKQIAVSEAESAFNDKIREYELKIKEFETKVESFNHEKQFAIEKALSDKEKELLNLNNQIAAFATEKEVVKQKKENEMLEKLSQKDSEIQKLKNQLDGINKDKELELTKVNSKKVEEIHKLENDHKLELTKLQQELAFKDEHIEQLKDFKTKQSTKMIGESLEQYCEDAFNTIRMSAFPSATFIKDNNVIDQTKGDYIYRELDEDGIEILSIMFEMKNQDDRTATKKKNNDFFKKLDGDRKKKKCEYAILVSMLEEDSDLYNNGIVDVSYQYEKMYVIRPQFFIPLISLLRNSALKALEYKKQAEIMRAQHIDISTFEDDVNTFKTNFSKNFDLASKKFKTAIEEIDKTIDHLQKTKANLLSSENNLRLANNKAIDLSIKKLVKKNPTMKERFDALKNE